MDIRTILDPSHGGYIAVGAKSHCQEAGNASNASTPFSSNDDVFSITSEASSQSSLGDSQDDIPSAIAKQDAPSNNLACLLSAAAIQHEASRLSSQDQQHQHPRRSFSTTKRPPSLPRQDERKVLFVNDLVDSATNLVSIIWPLSGSCAQPGSGRGVLPLRRYIEETLRRSRTSYSTLQVALYYLILIKPHVPSRDFTMEQQADSASTRALQCGRRMFLSALILASKYLQDRNYSAKAWSKMSGLKTCEINSNERLFLSAVSWKLHIPDSIFKRWTDVVLSLTAPPVHAVSSTPQAFNSRLLWAHAISYLTPGLDHPRILAMTPEGRLSLAGVSPSSAASSAPVASPPRGLMTPPPCEIMASPPTTICPRSLEARSGTLPPTPALIRMGPLPTPQMTPTSIASNTPAVSACSSRRSSMSTAMAFAQNTMINRITCDRFATPAPRSSGALRYPSVAPSFLSCSSPDSMMSDQTRTSRSSSISSVSALSTSAPTNIVSSAMHQATGRPIGGIVINIDESVGTAIKSGTAACPITILDDEDDSPVTTTLPLNTSSRKRTRTECDDEVISASPSFIIPDSRPLATKTVSPTTFRNAMLGLPSPETVKGYQALASLKYRNASGPSFQLPVLARNSPGRKRICSEVAANGQGRSVPDVFVNVGEMDEGLWQSVN